VSKRKPRMLCLLGFLFQYEDEDSMLLRNVCIIFTCMGIRVTKITGSRSDHWIYWYFGYKFSGTLVTSSLNHNYYNAIADLHNLRLTVAQAPGFSSSLVVSWQRISAQKLSLQITVKSSCQFVFNHSGTSELN
jgi:hypothetical protein